MGYYKRPNKSLSQVPTKPRTIITLPHLIGRQKPVSPKAADTTSPNVKAPIIIRERIEKTSPQKPDPNTVVSITSNNTSNVFNTNRIDHRTSSSP